MKTFSDDDFIFGGAAEADDKRTNGGSH